MTVELKGELIDVKNNLESEMIFGDGETLTEKNKKKLNLIDNSNCEQNMIYGDGTTIEEKNKKILLTETINNS